MLNWKHVVTYRAKAQKIILSGWMVKMFAMPRARQRIMDRMPSLV